MALKELYCSTHFIDTVKGVATLRAFGKLTFANMAKSLWS